MLYDPKWTPAETEIQLEPWQQILLKAADILETHGWCQKSFGDYHHGFCAIGAIRAVTAQPWDKVGITDPDGRRAAMKLYRNIRGQTIALWNDTYGRTKEEVIAKLREVAHAV